MTRTRLVRYTVLLGTALLAACPLHPETWVRVLGDLWLESEQPAPIALPEAARQGVPFTATVVTWGSSSCTRPSTADVTVSGLEADVLPYDLKLVGDVVCTDDMAPFPREVTLRFDEVGEAVVRVHGRQSGGGAVVYEARIAIEP